MNVLCCCFVCCFLCMNVSPTIFARITVLALSHSWGCHRVLKMTLTDVRKIGHYLPTWNDYVYIKKGRWTGKNTAKYDIICVSSLWCILYVSSNSFLMILLAIAAANYRRQKYIICIDLCNYFVIVDIGACLSKLHDRKNCFGNADFTLQRMLAWHQFINASVFVEWYNFC